MRFVAELLRGVRDSMWRVALLSLPGTIAHELTHLIVGLLLHAQPHGFSVWPRPRGNVAIGALLWWAYAHAI
jgi:hypothetical protein